MPRIAQVCLGVCLAWLAGCSSSDSTSGPGSTGGSAGADSAGPGGSGASGSTLNDAAPDAASGQNEASVDATSERSDARACEQMECFRANQCVSECGGAVVSSGCCACEAPLFDSLQCDAGQ